MNFPYSSRLSVFLLRCGLTAASAAGTAISATARASDRFPFFMVFISFTDQKNTISCNQCEYHNISDHKPSPVLSFTLEAGHRLLHPASALKFL